MSEAADNILEAERRRELGRRVAVLCLRSEKRGGERICVICGGHFAEQGRFDVSAHYSAAHAEQILAMPAERFNAA